MSPGLHCGATAVNDGGLAGVPSAVSRLKVNAIGLLSAGTERPVEDIATERESVQSAVAHGADVRDHVATATGRSRPTTRGPFLRDNANLCAEITHRIRIGAFVIDEETITG